MPTFKHGKGTKILVGWYDLSTSFKEFSASTSIDMAETSAFGNVYKTYIQGLGDATISLTGMWSGGTNEVDDVLGTAIGAVGTLPVIVCPDGYGVGKRAIGLGANESSYEITGSIGDVVAVSAEFQSTVNSGGKSGVLLTTGAGVTTTTTSAAVDNAAATTADGYALLSVPANSRNVTTTIRIEDSADSSSWATIGTFTVVGTGSVAHEYLAISGTIRRYTRSVITLASGTGSITAHVLLARF